MKFRMLSGKSGLSLFILLFILSLRLAGQPYTASFILHAPEQKVFLASYYGEKMALLDSGLTDKSGQIAFTFSQKRQGGIYRIFLNRQHFLEFIYNKEDVSIDMEINKGDEAPKVIKSHENEVFYHFLTSESSFKRKMNILQVVGSEYPEKDDFYNDARKQYDRQLKERTDLLNSMIDNNQGSFVASVLKLYKEPVLPWDLNEQERKIQLKEHYFDNYNLKDTLLIRTNLLTSKVIDYLSLYTNQQMNQSEAEQAFIKGIDVVLQGVQDNRAIFEFLLSYLVGGFEKYKMELVLTHLYEKYLSDIACDEGGRKDELARRLKAYEKLAVGRTAPDFLVHDKDGKEFRADALGGDYTLMVFWASWCPHCQQLLSKLPDLTQTYKELNIKVLTVSLDSNLTDWNAHLTKHNIPWTNTCEGKGWNGQVMKDYNIYATPTMFIIDRQRKIKAKPITYMDLTEALIQLGGK